MEYKTIRQIIPCTTPYWAIMGWRKADGTIKHECLPVIGWALMDMTYGDERTVVPLVVADDYLVITPMEDERYVALTQDPNADWIAAESERHVKFREEIEAKQREKKSKKPKTKEVSSDV